MVLDETSDSRERPDKSAGREPQMSIDGEDGGEKQTKKTLIETHIGMVVGGRDAAVRFNLLLARTLKLLP